MILSNTELFKALDAGRIVITPEPSPRLLSLGDEDCPYDTHSVDLRLGDDITVPGSGQVTFDLTQRGEVAKTIAQHSKHVKITPDQPYNLKPNTFVLGRTLETVELPIFADEPTCLAARMKSAA